MAWLCECGWSGDELKPVSLRAGVQGEVKSFSCPKCNGLVGNSVSLMDDTKPKPKKREPISLEEEISHEAVDTEEKLEESSDEENSDDDEEGFDCQYCGLTCKTPSGLSSHERACKNK